jgi:hypothetical protein
MRKHTTVWLLLAIVSVTPQVFALDGKDVAYVSGTVKGVSEGTAGGLETTLAEALEFRSSAGQFAIPYARIKSYQCREETKFHLGVLPAIAVALVKKRAKVHFVTIVWNDEGDTAEVAKLELSKNGSEALMDLLRARAPMRTKQNQAKTSARAGDRESPPVPTP